MKTIKQAAKNVNAETGKKAPASRVIAAAGAQFKDDFASDHVRAMPLG